LLQWLFVGGTAGIGSLGAACAIILPIAVAAGLAVYLVRRGQKAGAARQAAQSWASTTGTVLTSSVQVRRISRRRSEIPVVAYQYQVGGQAYQGNVIRAGDQFLTIRIMGQAQATAARYPTGSTVTVYYNPANPAEAALER
jgi:hypothetical protein